MKSINDYIKQWASIACLLSATLLPVSCNWEDWFGEEDDEEEQNDNNGGNNQSTAAKLYAQFSFENNVIASGQTSLQGVADKVSYVTSVNGSKAVEIAPEGSISIPEALIDGKTSTLMFWAKDLYDGHVLHVNSTAQYKVGFVLAVVNGKVKFVLNDYNSVYKMEDMPAFGNHTLDGWHHIAITNNAGTKTLYVDGVRTDEVIEPNTIYDCGIKLIIGGKMESPYLNNQRLTLDNLRIYRGVTTANEVKKVYDSEKPKNFKPGSGAETANVVNNALYAYFTFNGNSNNATYREVIPAINGTSFVDSYNGTKALKIPTGASLTIPEGLMDQKTSSICFWTKDLYDGHVFSVKSTAHYGIGFVLSVVNGKLKFILNDYNICNQYNNMSAFTNNTLEGWHHVVITNENGTKILYVDGYKSDQLVEGNASYQCGIKFTMGGSLDWPDINATTIIIDNLRVYKYRTITADEVKEIYHFEK